MTAAATFWRPFPRSRATQKGVDGRAADLRIGPIHARRMATDSLVQDQDGNLGQHDALPASKVAMATSPQLAAPLTAFRSRQRMTALSPATAAFLQDPEEPTSQLQEDAKECLTPVITSDDISDRCGSPARDHGKTMSRLEGSLSPIAPPCFDSDADGAGLVPPSVVSEVLPFSTAPDALGEESGVGVSEANLLSPCASLGPRE